MRRSAQALQQLAQQQGEAVAAGRALAAVARGAITNPPTIEKEPLPLFTSMLHLP
jgi:hypothetical protein